MLKYTPPNMLISVKSSHAAYNHTWLTVYICRPFYYDCTSRWPYEYIYISIGGIAKRSGFFVMCVGYDGKVLIPLWFVHEDSHLVDETM